MPETSPHNYKIPSKAVDRGYENAVTFSEMRFHDQSLAARLGNRRSGHGTKILFPDTNSLTMLGK